MQNATPPEKRTALVTGASRGIGKAIAIRMGAEGHRVAVNYNSHADDAAEVVDCIKSAGGEAFMVGADVSDSVQVKEMVAEVRERYGTIEILINNAGIISDSLVVRMKDEDFNRVIDVNLRGVYYCSRNVVNDMVKRRWGRIVNISSVVGSHGNAGQANYAASKAAVSGFTKSLAKELALRNITVNIVAPGYINTATSNVLSERMKEKLREFIPTRRFGEPDDIAPMVVFLTTKEASYITGQVINVDGGMGM